MLEIKNVYKTFNPGTVNQKVALNDLNLTLEDGDFVTVIGGNGAGKSTMLNAVAGVWPVDMGKIIIDGKDITRLPEHKRAAYIGRVFQDPMMGTAATMPLPDRALTAAVAECGGHSLLFDCGEGTQTAARRAGVNLMKMDAVCLTHYHGDHIFGLPGLLQTLGCQGRTRPLALYGPKGLGEVWAALRVLTGPLPYPVYAEVLDAPAALCEKFGGWPQGAKLTPVPTRHRVVSQGYRLDLPRAGRFSPEQARALGVPVKQWKTLQHGESITLDGGRVIQPEAVLGPARQGLSFVFSGDTAPCPALEKAAAGADLLLCDSTYALPEQAAQAKQYGHSTFGQSAALAAKAGAKRLWLVHYSPMITDPEEELAQAQSLFPAAECGFDGKQIILQYDEEAT